MNGDSQQSTEYLDRLNLSIKKQEALVIPLTASLQTAKWCNSRCRYCGIWKNPALHLPLGDLVLAIDELAALGVHLISLTGGEPFLHRYLAQIVQRIGSHGIISSIMTNGMLLKPEYVIPILEAGLNSLCVSLDTVDPATYRFLRGVPLPPVVEGLRYVSSIRQNFPLLQLFSINCVISHANIDQLTALIEFCSELNISVGFQPLHSSFESKYAPKELQFGPEEFPYLQKQVNKLMAMKEKGYSIDNDWAYLRGFPDFLAYRRLPVGTVCTSGFTTIAVDDELNVKSCWPKKPIGNLHKHKLSVLWKSNTYTLHRRSMLALECPGCWLRCHTDHLSVQWLTNLHEKIAEVKAR